MSGILGKAANKWISLTNNSAFDIEKIYNTQVPDPNNEGSLKKVGAFEGEEKSQVMYAMEAAANNVYRMLNGSKRENVKIKDFVKNSLTTGTFTSVFTPTVEVFMTEYIRPRLIVSNLLATTIPIGPSMNRGLLALIRSFGLIKVQEVGKDQKLPTVTPNLSEYTDQMAISTKRYGVKLEIENELQQSDQWGILGFLFTQIADGFRFRKELEVIKVLNGTGEVMYDNITPTNGTFGVHTGGRAIDGSFNGTVTMEDIQRIIGYAAMRGNDIRYMLVHPFVIWNMIGDSDLRNIVASSIPASPTGNAADAGWDHPFGDQFGYLLRHVGGAKLESGNPQIGQWGNIGLGPLGTIGPDPFTNNKEFQSQYLTGRANIPGANVTLITSPQVPITSINTGGSNKIQTNMYFIADRSPVAIMQEANPATLEWEDIEMETSYIGFREKYTVLPLYQGRGVYTVKGAVVDKNYNFNIVSQIGALSEASDTLSLP